MIKKYALIALQTAVHQALALDDAMPEKLAPLEGRVIKMIIRPLHLYFYMRFAGGQLYLLDDYPGAVDTTIQSSPIGLIRLSVLPASKVRSLFNDSIQISGDVELGQAIKRVFDQIDLDWEGHLAQLTGDAIAYQLGSVVRQGIAYTQHVHQSMQHHVTEYVQEELRLFPPREEINDFFNDVDELALRVERLSAHVNQWRVTHEGD